MRLAFVTPRYGAEIVGGSEAVMAEAARALGERGHLVDVLTTCARSHVTWENEHDPGAHRDGPVTVRRFLTVTGSARLLAARLERRIQRGERLEPSEEIAWLNGRMRVPELYFHLLEHASEYDAVLCSPYLFWTTVYATAVDPDRTIVLPCLHDEAYARLGVVASTLGAAGGTWYLSEPEHELAAHLVPELAPHQRVVGAAVEVPETYEPEAFRARYGLERPFLLYAGRREGGKGWPVLLDQLAQLERRGELDADLVTIGSGRVAVPEVLRERVHDLGFLDRAELSSAFAAAVALVQPSQNESFSRTVMESFLAQTPVLATAAGKVVAWHLARCGAGSTYADGEELGAQVRGLLADPRGAARRGAAGRAYVLEHYTWAHVADAMESALAEFCAARR